MQIEDENSDFSAHKTEVIKQSIESNLITAIDNYNEVSSSQVKFAMPKLTEVEWDDISHNISMITFLQGLSIGGKIYNGHAIVANNVNDDYVSEDSIYIACNNTYYKPSDGVLLDPSIININNAVGFVNTDFERKSLEDKKLERTVYYYPREDDASYSSIVNSNGGITTLNGQTVSILQYFDKNYDAHNSIGLMPNENSQKYKLAQKYYTALGRERLGMYRSHAKYEMEDLLN